MTNDTVFQTEFFLYLLDIPAVRFTRIEKILLQIQTVIKREKDKLFKLENQAVAKNEFYRPRILQSIFSQQITYYKLNGNTKVNQKDSFDSTTTHD